MRGVTEPERPISGPEPSPARRAVEAALTAGDPATAARIFQRHLLEITYQLRADALRPWLQHFIDSGADATGIANGMIAFFASREVRELQRSRDTLPPVVNGVPISKLIAMGQMIEFRLRGDLTRATQHTAAIKPSGVIHAAAFDANDGWELMFAVQIGTTAMLAGDSKAALSAFTAARMHTVPPGLSFLSREATVRAALIHATFGDSREAERDLEHAARIPRTGGWIDERADTTVTLAQSLIELSDPERSRALIDQVELHTVGEMWPYYLIALQRAYARSGYGVDLALKMDIFEGLPFARIPGDGLTGSIFPLISATTALVAGNCQRASALLDKTDPTLSGSRLMRAFLALSAGRAPEALELTTTLHDQTQGLRQFDVWRLGVKSAALHMLGRLGELLEVLREAAALPGGLRPEELRHFPAAVHQFGAEHLPEWPRCGLPQEPSFVDTVSRSVILLSSRELEILRLLPSGRSRADIAALLFLSLNTIKTHLASIYRKLGVSNRSGALREAGNRGLL